MFVILFLILRSNDASQKFNQNSNRNENAEKNFISNPDMTAAEVKNLERRARQIIECGLAAHRRLIPRGCFTGGISLKRDRRFSGALPDFVKSPKSNFCSEQMCQRSRLLLDIHVCWL